MVVSDLTICCLDVQTETPSCTIVMVALVIQFEEAMPSRLLRLVIISKCSDINPMNFIRTVSGY